MKEPSSSVRLRPSTLSLVKRPEMEELLTSRDSSRFDSAVISVMFGLSSQVGAISRAQEVLLSRIECIALRVETLLKEVQFLGQVSLQTETNLQQSSELPSAQEIEDWLISPPRIPDVGCGADLLCSEMLNLSSHPSNDHQFQWNGSMELPVWARADVPTRPSPTPILRSQEPSGGMDTCKRKKSS